MDNTNLCGKYDIAKAIEDKVVIEINGVEDGNKFNKEITNELNTVGLLMLNRSIYLMPENNGFHLLWKEQITNDYKIISIDDFINTYIIRNKINTIDNIVDCINNLNKLEDFFISKNMKPIVYTESIADLDILKRRILDNKTLLSINTLKNGIGLRLEDLKELRQSIDEYINICEELKSTVKYTNWEQACEWMSKGNKAVLDGIEYCIKYGELKEYHIENNSAKITNVKNFKLSLLNSNKWILLEEEV